jgi:hypothetical protein
VGQGKIKWDDCAKHAILREKVMSDWPKVHEFLLMQDFLLTSLVGWRWMAEEDVSRG